MRDVLTAFDQFLEKEDLTFTATVIEAIALLVMGVIDRATVDVDCLAPTIPDSIRKASQKFARNYKGPDSPLMADWLYNGPESLSRDLPSGWEQDLEDCLALKTSLQELKECAPWLEKLDANPQWPAHVQRSLRLLGERLGFDGFET